MNSLEKWVADVRALLLVVREIPGPCKAKAAELLELTPPIGHKAEATEALGQLVNGLHEVGRDHAKTLADALALHVEAQHDKTRDAVHHSRRVILEALGKADVTLVKLPSQDWDKEVDGTCPREIARRGMADEGYVLEDLSVVADLPTIRWEPIETPDGYRWTSAGFRRGVSPVRDPLTIKPGQVFHVVEPHQIVRAVCVASGKSFEGRPFIEGAELEVVR